MASDQIFAWLNHEVKLSRYVTNPEKDFANGYLFAELLTKHKLVDHNHFCDRDNMSDKINNYRLLEGPFKRLGVELNQNKAKALILQEKGLALQILHQIRSAIEELNQRSQPTKQIKSGKTEPLHSILKPTSPRNDKFARTISVMFSHRANNFVKSPKESSMDLRVTKFAEFRIRSQERAQMEIIRENERKAQIVKERKRVDLKMLHRHMFQRKEIEEKGWIEWEKNIQKKKAHEKEEKDFYIKMAKRSEAKLMLSLSKERIDTFEGLSFVEVNKRRLKLSTAQGGERGNKWEDSTGTNMTNKSKDRMKFW